MDWSNVQQICSARRWIPSARVEINNIAITDLVLTKELYLYSLNMQGQNDEMSKEEEWAWEEKNRWKSINAANNYWDGG